MNERIFDDNQKPDRNDHPGKSFGDVQICAGIGKRTPDAMAPKETIDPGQTRAFAVQPGCYDYHAWGYELGRLLGEVSVTGGTVNVGSGAKETVTITSALKK